MKKLVNFIKNLRPGQSIKRKKAGKASLAGVVVPRDQHDLSRNAMSENALKVLYRLHNSGFCAYLVGGGVRDLLLGREPKDFDIATDAQPEQVRKLFRNCRLIGKRFRLAHVYFKQEIIEVATFRAEQLKSTPDQTQTEHGLMLRDNVYGDIEDDVWRRDFTANALYYNIADFSIVDYTDGLNDLQAGLLRIIGDPEQRYREDPVRMLRAVRFAAKLGFHIEEITAAPIGELGHLLTHVSNARLFDEVVKLFLGGSGEETFALLRHYQLLDYLLPATEACLCDQNYHQIADILILHTLKNTDQRISEEKPVTPAFLFAAMLWYPIQKLAQQYQQQGERPVMAMQRATQEILSAQAKHTAIPKRLVLMMREIWGLQSQLIQRRGKRVFKLLYHPRFRASYDFLLLRADAEPQLAPLANWWTDFIQMEDEQREQAVAKLKKHPVQRRTNKKPSDEQ